MITHPLHIFFFSQNQIKSKETRTSNSCQVCLFSFTCFTFFNSFKWNHNWKILTDTKWLDLLLPASSLSLSLFPHVFILYSTFYDFFFFFNLYIFTSDSFFAVSFPSGLPLNFSSFSIHTQQKRGKIRINIGGGSGWWQPKTKQERKRRKRPSAFRRRLLAAIGWCDPCVSLMVTSSSYSWRMMAFDGSRISSREIEKKKKKADDPH